MGGLSRAPSAPAAVDLQSKCFDPTGSACASREHVLRVLTASS